MSLFISNSCMDTNYTADTELMGVLSQEEEKGLCASMGRCATATPVPVMTKNDKIKFISASPALRQSASRASTHQNLQSTTPVNFDKPDAGAKRSRKKDDEESKSRVKKD